MLSLPGEILGWWAGNAKYVITEFSLRPEFCRVILDFFFLIETCISIGSLVKTPTIPIAMSLSLGKHK